MDWNTVPLRARAAPTERDRITLGSLRDMMMPPVTRSPEPEKAAKISRGE
jgi:hypothetical protein